MIAIHESPLPSRSDLALAWHQIKPFVQATPVLRSTNLSELIHGDVFLKAESLQVTGAFKFRGALYRLLNLSIHEKKQGVVAYSSGNFAAGLAAAGQFVSVPVKLVMPCDAPKSKIENARRYGAEVVLCDSSSPSREEAASQMAQELAEQERRKLLHPFDDRELIIGQASVTLELLEQLTSLSINPDHILCPTGGGSLVTGASLSTQQDTSVWAIEADSYNGMGLSITSNTRVKASGSKVSDCDALMALEPGVENLNIALQTGIKGLAVSAQPVKDAMKLLFKESNLVVEPSGAIAVAAIIENPHLFSKSSVVVIVSGGNVDCDKYVEMLASSDY